VNALDPLIADIQIITIMHYGMGEAILEFVVPELSV
jgi:hypothetical protein